MAKKIIKLTESEFKDVVKEAVERLISEGIEVDDNRNVLMTDKHENLVDTSAANNPTVLTDFVPNIAVWSIFKRKEGDFGDGNPLLYALKMEGGYKLLNRTKVLSRLEYIVGKFFESNSGMDVTIAVPSTNKLNAYFASVVARGCSNPQYIDNLLVKLSIEEVDDFVVAENSPFRNYYKSQYSQKYAILRNYYRGMRNGFQFHKIYDKEMRKVIEHTIKLNNEFYGRYVEAINDKNVLIIDDSLTLGNTIKESCKIISEMYTPKSITVLTLFSPLYREDGSSLSNVGQ